MPDAFVSIANADELRPGECKVVAADGLSLALYNVAGKFFVTTNECPHRRGPLGDGFLDGHVVVCPWHDWAFDVTTGANVDTGICALKTYEVRVEDSKVQVKLERDANPKDKKQGEGTWI